MNCRQSASLNFFRSWSAAFLLGLGSSAAEPLPVGETGVASRKRLRGDPKRNAVFAPLLPVFVSFAGGRNGVCVLGGRRLRRAEGQRPFHVLFQVKEREAPLAVPKARRQSLSASLSGREQDGAGDGRSVFHSRVGYRMSACRRGITSV